MNRVIGTDGLSFADALDICTQVVGRGGFSATHVTRSSVTFGREYRPGWVIPASIVAAAPTLGLSMLALRIRRHHVCTVTIETLPLGTRVHLTGVLDAAIVHSLEEQLARPPLRPPDPTDLFPELRTIGPSDPTTLVLPVLNPVPGLSGLQIPALPPVAPSRFPAHPARPDLHPPSPPSLRPTLVLEPHPDVLELIVEPDVEEVPDVEEAPVPVSLEWVLVFDDGQEVVVTGTGVVGRNPRPKDRNVQVVRPADPERSLSATHLAFDVEAGELWVQDRRSTNGSWVAAPDAEPVPCVPGERTAVPAGSRVGMGARWFETAVRAPD